MNRIGQMIFFPSKLISLKIQVILGCFLFLSRWGCAKKSSQIESLPQSEKKVAGIKLVQGPDTLVYMIGIQSPWPEGGQIDINLPEHLMWENNNNSILDYRDFKENQWKIAADGKTADFQIESPTVPGVTVDAKIVVVGEDQVKIKLTITNNGKVDLNPVKSLFCCRYQPLTGFPQWPDNPEPNKWNLEHTFVMIGGNLKDLGAIPTKDSSSNVKGTIVAGNKKATKWDTWWSRRNGGDFFPGVDVAITSVTALDNKRKLVYAWTPGSSMFSNANIPCIHADPYFGNIKAGQSVSVQGLVLFTERELAEVYKELVEQGIGAPAPENSL